MWVLTVRARLSQHEESHGTHGNFYEGEQEQCHSVPAGVLHGGLRISQWHKLCWSCAGITLAGTTGQLRLSRSFPGPTFNPTYLLCLHIYISAFVFHFVVVAVIFSYSCHVGSYSHFNVKFVQGRVNTTHFSLGAVHSANGIET